MTDISQGPTDRRRVPAWVGVALVVICFVAGAAFIWWVVRDPLSGGSDFIPDPNGSTSMRPRAVFRAPPNPESIRKTSDDNGGVYVAQAFGTVMNIEENNGNPKYTFRYLKKDLLPADIKDVLLMKFRIMQDDAVAQHIGLTDDQKQKLGKISTNVTNLAPPPADREKLVAQWQQYFAANDAGKSDAEKTLLATLKQVGDDNVASTRQKAEDRANEIKGILSADQIKKFQDMNNGP
jgi:Spy/CpxP family protein refolding chaperone